MIKSKISKASKAFLIFWLFVFFLTLLDVSFFHFFHDYLPEEPESFKNRVLLHNQYGKCDFVGSPVEEKELCEQLWLLITIQITLLCLAIKLEKVKSKLRYFSNPLYFLKFVYFITPRALSPPTFY